MKKKIFQEIKIPEGIEATLDGSLLKVKGPEGENSRIFNSKKAVFELKDGVIRIGSETATKNEKKIINSISSHVRNMIKGVQEKFEYQLKVVSSHFPITVEKKESEVIIKNFLGEKVSRKSKILPNVEVEIQKDTIIVKSVDKELAGQTAANFETATKIRNRDRRVFQDGIYMINKSGKEI